MRIIVNLTAAFICMLFFIQLSAQKKSFPGFYLTLNGEKVEGDFIHYKQWSRNPVKVSFIPAGSVTTLSLTPANCLMFAINGYDEYIAYKGKRMINPINDVQEIIKKSVSLEDQHSDISTFLRLVIRKPDCDLYILNDSVRTNLFYKLPGAPLTELKFKEYFDQTEIRTVPEYRKQLHSLFSDAIVKQKLEWSLEKLPYREEAMLKFINNLFPAEKTNIKHRSPGAGWVIAAGTSLNLLNAKGNNRSIEVGQKYKPSISPVFSIAYMQPFNRHFGKYFFYPQVKLFRHQNSTEVRDNYIRTTVTFKSDLIISPELNVGANVLNSQNFRFYLSAGAGLMHYINNKHIRNRYSDAEATPYFTSENNLSKVTYTMNLSGGLTLNKRFLVMANYRFSSPIGSLGYFWVTGSGVQFRVGYKLL